MIVIIIMINPVSFITWQLAEQTVGGCFRDIADALWMLFMVV